MQPIVVLAVFAAAIAMSIGYLGNDIGLAMIQPLGVGETDLTNPVKSVDLTIRIDRTFGMNSLDFKDLIVDCIFRSPNQVASGSTLICKLVDNSNSVVAEGRKELQTLLPANSPTVIPIDQTFFANSNNLNLINDIIFIVQGPRQTGP